MRTQAPAASQPQTADGREATMPGGTSSVTGRRPEAQRCTPAPARGVQAASSGIPVRQEPERMASAAAPEREMHSVGADAHVQHELECVDAWEAAPDPTACVAEVVRIDAADMPGAQSRQHGSASEAEATAQGDRDKVLLFVSSGSPAAQAP